MKESAKESFKFTSLNKLQCYANIYVPDSLDSCEDHRWCWHQLSICLFSVSRMELVWHGEFDRLFGQYYPHTWYLIPTFLAPNDRWRVFKDSAKVRFSCGVSVLFSGTSVLQCHHMCHHPSDDHTNVSMRERESGLGNKTDWSRKWIRVSEG